MLGEEVELEVNEGSRTESSQIRDFEGVGNDPDGEGVLIELGDGEADPIDADRSFVDDEMCEILGQRDAKSVILSYGSEFEDFDTGVDMALDKMPTETVADA